MSIWGTEQPKEIITDTRTTQTRDITLFFKVFRNVFLEHADVQNVQKAAVFLFPVVLLLENCSNPLERNSRVLCALT